MPVSTILDQLFQYHFQLKFVSMQDCFTLKQVLKQAHMKYARGRLVQGSVKTRLRQRMLFICRTKHDELRNKT